MSEDVSAEHTPLFTSHDPVYFQAPESARAEIERLVTMTPSTRVIEILRHHLQNLQIQDSVFSSVLAVNDVLPHVPLNRIRAYLAFTENRHAPAIDMLLNDVPIGADTYPDDGALVSSFPLRNVHPSTLAKFRALQAKAIRLAKREKLVFERLRLRKTQIARNRKKESGGDAPGEPSSDIFSLKRITMEERILKRSMVESQRAKNLRFYCQGERQLVERGSGMKIYTLPRTFEFHCLAEEIQYRLAESQFARWIAPGSLGGGVYQGQRQKVVGVEYVVNPKIMRKFDLCRKRLAKKHGWLESSMKDALLFHGTSKVNQDSILKTNFLLKKIGSATDMGYYGKGFYLSEFPALSIGYSRGHNQLLLCRVLFGKCYKQVTVITGCAKQEGFDCHISGNGTEVVIFDPDQILPCYRITFSA